MVPLLCRVPVAKQSTAFDLPRGPPVSRALAGNTCRRMPFLPGHVQSLCAAAVDDTQQGVCLVTGAVQLLRGVDRDKDQSYFLASVRGNALQNVLFPLGDLTKAAVRGIAQDAGLHVAGRRSSAGICFIGPPHPRSARAGDAALCVMSERPEFHALQAGESFGTSLPSTRPQWPAHTLMSTLERPWESAATWRLSPTDRGPA